jgi:hypothetical protein
MMMSPSATVLVVAARENEETKRIAGGKLIDNSGPKAARAIGTVDVSISLIAGEKLNGH